MMDACQLPSQNCGRVAESGEFGSELVALGLGESRQGQRKCRRVSLGRGA